MLQAALALFLERGVEGSSIEEIARRAGVAKTSIYRRWPNREALLAQAIETARNRTGYTVDLVDRTPPDKLAGLLLDACQLLAQPEFRKLTLRIIGSIADSPNLLAIYRAAYFLPRREAFVRALERATAAGLLPDGTDPDIVADMFTGSLMYRVIMGAPEENSAAELRRQMRRLLRQIGLDSPT